MQQRALWLGPWPRCATPAKPSSAAAMEPRVTAMCSLAPHNHPSYNFLQQPGRGHTKEP